MCVCGIDLLDLVRVYIYISIQSLTQCKHFNVTDSNTPLALPLNNDECGSTDRLDRWAGLEMRRRNTSRVLWYVFFFSFFFSFY